MILLILNTVVPVFGIVALGYLLSGLRRLDIRTIADMSILMTSPALIFTVLAETQVEPAQWLTVMGGVVWVSLGTALAALLYIRFARNGRSELRGLLLPAIFWNAGNMGLPCAQLAFGDEGLRTAVIVFVTMAILQSTVSIWIANGPGGWREVFRIPLLYACVAGLVVTIWGITVPKMIYTPVKMVGSMAIPLMLVNLGVQLRQLEVREVHHSIVAVGVRIVGGFLCALLFVTLFQVTGTNRNVLILDAAMPPAVINVIIAQRYDISPTSVASSIVLGTVASVVTIPLVLAFLSLT